MSQYGQNPQGDYSQPNYGSQPYGQSQQGGYGSYQQPTGMQQYAAYGQQPEHPQAQTVLILGILGFFTSIISIVALGFIVLMFILMFAGLFAMGSM